MTFQRTETVVCSVSIATNTGGAITPDTSVKITIYDPTNTPVVLAQDMVEDSTGEFHYDYTSAPTAILGVYRVRITATHSSRVTIKEATFVLEA